MFIFKLNDRVVYGSTGICRIVDIRKEKDVDGNVIEFYILQPIYSNNMIIKTPVNNKKVLMRRIISKDEVSSLIAAMPEKETIWIDDYRQRTERFKAILKKGECEELIKLIKTLYLEKQKKAALGKKLIKSDEEMMKAAEKHLHEEFAVVLNILPEEVLPYILEHTEPYGTGGKNR